MAKINVLAGDFLQGNGEFHSGTITLVTPLFPWPGICFKQDDIKSVEIVSKATNRRMDDAIGKGIAGALVLGPVGAAAGMLLANEEKEITFVATLKDGRSMLAATDENTYRKMAEHIPVSDFM
ncbi:hypothetical protein K5D40_16400 [Pseudomonas cichorii]|nr:hypothetical protein [Pseudomonas cichorii]MBX8603804.1 hypothetical protein [Pseudomonas cichorii]